MSLVPSKFQAAILEAVSTTINNLGINAVAGSGKSATLRMICEVLPLDQSTIICAFNKDIAEAMRPKVPQHIHVKTLNGFGHGIVTKAFKGVKLDMKKTEMIFQLFLNMNDRADRDIFYKYKNLINKVVAMCKATLDWPQGNDVDAWEHHINKMIDTFGWDTPKEGLKSNFYGLAIDTFYGCVNRQNIIDFDDQLFFPIYYDLDIPQYDNFLIDECQDLNRVQIELVVRAGKRVIACGDPCQAIYGFRGADAAAYELLMERINAVQLPLSVCYRCPKKVIDEAKKIVPQIEAADTAADGEVATITYQQFKEQAQEGDFVLARCTAPLVSGCLEMIREDRKAVVLGRDVGDQLISLIKKLANGGDDSREFYENLKFWEGKEIERLSRTENDAAIQIVQDKVATLAVLVEAAPTVTGMIDKVNQIFSKNAAGITFGTIHKMKGMETDNTFILEPHMMSHPMAKLGWQKKQEMNAKYVALTRCRKSMKWVNK